ncbi:MAG: peroxiredoxin, partial [Opitutaceae bacterium]|nr:peroxiredoxin [Opitutaceae bacterium]
MGTLNLLNIGDKAPIFSFKDPDSGEIRDTSTLLGKPFLVYFYPRDNTPGCTKEACGFRDLFHQFQEAGVFIIGVSCDTEVKHDKFRAKYDLPFPLVADIDKKLVKEFGVWASKTFMGRIFDGIHRV